LSKDLIHKVIVIFFRYRPIPDKIL